MAATVKKYVVEEYIESLITENYTSLRVMVAQVS